MTDTKQAWNSTEVESDPFLGAGCNLDTRGRRLDPANLQRLAETEEESFLDERFGGMVHEQRDMRKELAALADDPTVLEQLAKTDPAAAEKLQEQRAEAAALEFIAATPEYYVCESNSDRLDSWLEAHHLPWSAENLGRAYSHLLAAGALKVSPHVFRVVPASEVIRLARMAANGDPQTALSAWLHLRVPQAVADAMSNSEDYWAVEKFLSDPDLQPVMAEGLTAVWFWSHPNVRPTQELRDFFKSYTAEMTVFNWQTLNSAWLAHFDHRETQNELQKRNALLGLRGELPADPPESQAEIAAGLEELPDAEIARLMKGVARERAGRRPA